MAVLAVCVQVWPETAETGAHIVYLHALSFYLACPLNVLIVKSA